MNAKLKRKRTFDILLKFYLVLILLVLLTVASYTWFAISRKPKVSDMALYINSGTGMELALEPQAEEWTQQLKLADLLDGYTPLRPVTWSDRDQCFYTASYGMDGRLSGIAFKLSDERNANRSDNEGFYIKLTFYARTGEPVSVSLSEALAVDQNTQGAGTWLIGTPIWNDQTILHDDGGQGAQYAMRIGLRISKLGLDGSPLDEESVFYIYEPNCNGHANGSTEYVATPSIDGSALLVPEDRLILQTMSSWSEVYPVQREVLMRHMGEFMTDRKLFELDVEEVAQIEVYVWLEGQDPDCSNFYGTEAQILANLQFSASADTHSGLQPIE